MFSHPLFISLSAFFREERLWRYFILISIENVPYFQNILVVLRAVLVRKSDQSMRPSGLSAMAIPSGARPVRILLTTLRD